MVLDSVFGFLLNYPPIITVTIFSIFVLILINIFYKILINQNEAKLLKERTKDISKRMREEQKKGDTKKSTELLSEMMRENNKLMKMTFKPMITSFIIVIVLLPWLSGHFGDRLIDVKDNAGEMNFLGVDYEFTALENTVTVDGKECELPCTEKIGGHNFDITKEGEKIKFAPVVAMAPIEMPFTGVTVGWLYWYVLVSIPLTFLIRKLMKIYV